MFLGNNWATCIDSSKYSGVKPNHIYLCIGAYNLEDEKFESYYHRQRSTSTICRPTWVMPSLTKCFLFWPSNSIIRVTVYF